MTHEGTPEHAPLSRHDLPMSDAGTSRGLGLRRLSGNAGRTFIAQILAALLGVGISLLLSRTLGKAGVGVYAMALLLPNMLVQLLEFGITYANVYHIGRGDVNAREVMRANLRIWGFISAVGLGIAGLVIALRGAQWFPGIPTPLLIISALAFPPALMQLYCLSILQGHQDFKRFNYLTVTVQMTTFTLSAISVLIFHLGVAACITAYLIGQVLALTITSFVLRPYLARSPESEVHQSWWAYGRKAVNYGWKQHLSAVISFVNLRVDLFFVNLFLAPASAGIYYVAIQFGESMWIISKVVSTVLLPRLAELHDQEQTRLQLTPLITRLVFNFTALAALVVAVLIKPVVTLLWGKDFSQVANVLWWLLPGIVMWSATRIIAYDFAARGRPELNSYLAGIVLVINVALNVILIPRVGIIGGAISTTVAYTANTFATIYLYRQFSDLASWKLLVLQREDVRLLAEAGRVALAKFRRKGELG
jgi:O-antigen/teichoic acid export membrane protein